MLKRSDASSMEDRKKGLKMKTRKKHKLMKWELDSFKGSIVVSSHQTTFEQILQVLFH